MGKATLEEINTEKFIYMICVFIIFVKVFMTNMRQGKATTLANNRIPEDYQAFGGKLKNPNEVTEENRLDEQRWKRQVMNDLENIPIALLVFLISFYVNHSSANVIVNDICIIIFTISRVMYTISYAYALQPWRSIFWAIANLSTFTCGINGIVDAARLL